MKKSIRNIFVLAVLGFMGLPLFFFDSNRVASEREKRKLAEYPFLLTDNRINKNFFSEYDSYFQDHFGFREQLIRFNEKIPLKIQKSIESRDAFSGKNGWYFINYDKNLKDFAKKNLLTADELKEFKKNISNTMEWCKAQNIPCVFLICPNKHSVYPEFYPFERPDGITRADQMTTVFDELDANYIFPRDYILLKKAYFDFPLYYETDTHWNPQGAYLASILLREKIQKIFPDANFPKIEYETKIDYSMTAERTEPIAESSHTVHIPQFQRQGKILIERKIGSNNASEVTQYLVSVIAAKPNALKRVEIAVIGIETHIGKAHKVLVVFAHLLTVQLFCFLVGEDKCRHFGSCCRAGRNIVLRELCTEYHVRSPPYVLDTFTYIHYYITLLVKIQYVLKRKPH